MSRISGELVDVVATGVYTRVTHVTSHMSPICGCHGCRFEKPRLERQVAELKRTLSELASAVENDYRPAAFSNKSINVSAALISAHMLVGPAIAERAA